MSVDELEILLAAIILTLFAIFSVWMYIDHKAQLKREDSLQEESRTIYLEVLQELYRTGKKTNTPRDQMELLTLRDLWLKIPKLTIQEKTLAIRAGLKPQTARKTVKKMGAEALAAQAYLRCGKPQTVS